MSPEILFQMQGVLGYVAWLLCFGVLLLRPQPKAVRAFAGDVAASLDATT